MSNFDEINRLISSFKDFNSIENLSKESLSIIVGRLEITKHHFDITSCVLFHRLVTTQTSKGSKGDS